MLATFKCNMEQSTTKYETNKIWLLVYFLTLPPLPCSPLTSWTDWGIWRHIKGKSVLRTDLGQPINKRYKIYIWLDKREKLALKMNGAHQHLHHVHPRGAAVIAH